MESGSPTSAGIGLAGGLFGLVVGDALGVPVQFWPRARVRADPVDGLRPGPGALPPGTWSDDSSMALALADSLARAGWDLEDQMARFGRWLLEGEYTPHGEAWDIGGTTRRAIFRYAAGDPIETTGDRLESQNGNGSLMRLLPASIWLAADPADVAIERAMAHSGLTHANVRARLCCAYHALLVRGLLAGEPLRPAMAAASDALEPHVPDEERSELAPILTGEILDREDADVESSGYVVHTLGAALWCLARHDDYGPAVLEAVNLGGDADTTAAVTGGLAGLIHGFHRIPDDWVRGLQRLDVVGGFLEAFATRAQRRLEATI